MNRHKSYLVAATAGLGALLVSTPAVHADNTQSVQVVNDPSQPVPVRDTENPAREAFSVALACSAIEGHGCSAPLPFSIPAGKRMVVETITARADVTTGGNVHFTAQLSLNGSPPIYHFLERQYLGGTLTGRVAFVSTQAVRFYADPGNSGFWLHLSRYQGSGASYLNATVTGYLVDCGSGPGCPIP